MEIHSNKNIAHKQTRTRCFLGLDVVAGDFSGAVLQDWTSVLTPNSGAGLWMVPFRGIAATDVKGPARSVYLDKDCRAIDEVGFFPPSVSPPPAPRPQVSWHCQSTRSIRPELNWAIS